MRIDRVLPLADTADAVVVAMADPFNDEAAGALAFHAAEAGLVGLDGTVVAVVSGGNVDPDRYLEYLFGVPWANAVLNPINTRWSAQEVAYCLNDSDSRVLLVDDALAPMVPALREACPQLQTVIHAGDGPTPDGMLSYEDLVAAATPIPDCRRGGVRRRRAALPSVVCQG